MVALAADALPFKDLPHHSPQPGRAMENVKKNVALLATCQALLFTNNTTAIAINGLAGFALASDKALATLPATGLVIGGALATFPASLLMKRIGRRAGFQTGTAIGVAPGASLIVAKAFGRYGGSDDKDLLAALQWIADPDGNPATADGAKVVSCSWNVDPVGGTPSSTDDPFCQALENLRRFGIVPVFSAGNDGPGSGSIKPPGACPAAFTVGATDDVDRLADFSSRGPSHWRDVELIKPDVVAPGGAQRVDL